MVEQAPARLRFVTLGPAGSNHEFVARRYLAFHGLEARADILLADRFDQAAAQVLAGQADFLLQCAVHPETPRTVARFYESLFLIDSFIAPSQELAVLRRRDRPNPRRVAAMAATVDYVDLRPWGELVLQDTVAAVGAALAEGRVDAGLAFRALAAQWPEALVVERLVPSPDDAWLVYGRSRLSGGGLLGCADGPAARLYKHRGAALR